MQIWDAKNNDSSLHLSFFDQNTVSSVSAHFFSPQKRILIVKASLFKSFNKSISGMLDTQEFALTEKSLKKDG